MTWHFMGPELPFEGCIDTDATNYNEEAIFSDNSCIYPAEYHDGYTYLSCITSGLEFTIFVARRFNGN